MNDYKQKLLKSIKTFKLPEKVIYFDIETTGKKIGEYEKHTFKLGWTCLCYYDKQGKVIYEEWKEWFHSNLLCNYIHEIALIEKSLYLFSHNIFFDLQACRFFYTFTHKGYHLNFYYDKGLTYMLLVKKGGHNITALSTTNYYSVSLKELGEFISLEKLDVDFEIVSDSDLSIYCRRDVEIVKKAMEFYYQFILINRLGKFSYSKSGQSFCAYRYRFMKHKIYLHEDKVVKELERDSYIGGRVECFQLGKIKGTSFTTLDVNSMYPYIMKTINVPVKLINYRENPDVSFVRDIVKTFCVIAKVEVNTDIPIYAVRHDKKVIFPIGNFNCFLCTEGIKEALNRGHLVSVKQLAVYQRALIFKEYVDFFYELKLKYKKENNKIMCQLCKYFLVSLYGKFAQKCPIQEIEKDFTFDGFYRLETYDLVTGEVEIEYKMFNTKVVEKGFEEGKNSFVAITSHITEAARIKLWHLIEFAGREKVLYCDTDGFKIRTEDISNIEFLLDESKLGYLKIEDKSKSLEILGLKSYITDSERVIKGIPLKAVEVSTDVYKYVSFLKQATHMKKQVDDGVLLKTMYKSINRNYDKGYVLNDGKILPFRFSKSLPLSEQPQLPF